MMILNTELHIADPDAFYEMLIEAHAGLDDAHSHALNARIVQALSEMVADPQALREAASIAGENQAPPGTSEYNAKLILLLANHVGDAAKLAKALKQARAVG